MAEGIRPGRVGCIVLGQPIGSTHLFQTFSHIRGVEYRRDNQVREGDFRREEQFKGRHRGSFGGRGGPIRDDRNRSNSKWEDHVATTKGDELKKGWGDILPNTWVLRYEDRGTCFRCLQSGHHHARCTNPLVCYKCKKSGHMTTNCLEDKKCQGMKLFGFGILGQGFYSLQILGLMLSEQQVATWVTTIKERVASVERIEVEMKHLIQANWNRKVRKISENEYIVVFSSKDVFVTPQSYKGWNATKLTC